MSEGAGYAFDPRPGEGHRGRVIPLVRENVVGGNPDAVRRRHALGKHSARERLAMLLDEGSFTEVQLYRRKPGGPHTDGVVTGSGTIDGRRVYVYAQDFTQFGGSLGAAHAAKIHKVMDLAIATGSPIIGLNDSGGAPIREGVLALHGYGGIFRRQVEASGVIPQISVVLGPCAGGAAYSPALADFTFMVRDTARIYLTGLSEVATVVCDDEESCLADVRRLVSMLPGTYLEQPPRGPVRDAETDARPRLAEIVPVESSQHYDMRDVLEELADDGDFFELHEGWARNVICALARIDGHVVGIVGNQPMILAGVLDGAASLKAARFVRFCDAFGIPLVTLVDVPGFLPGVEQEHSGIIRHGAQLLHAYCEATVPRVQVILRKAYGGAYIVMDSRAIGTDLSLVWPTYPEEFTHARYAAERGLVDDVIDPVDTRSAIARGLAMVRDKRTATPRRKHANPPV